MAIKPLIQNVPFTNNGTLSTSYDTGTNEFILSLAGAPFEMALTQLNVPSLDVRLKNEDIQKVMQTISASRTVSTIV